MVVKKHARKGALMFALALCPLLQTGCFFTPPDPGAQREERVAEALALRENAAELPRPLTPEAAVAYALRNSLDSRAAALELAYQEEALSAARYRMLPSLNSRYLMDNSNHPSARSSVSASSGTQSLESSYSSDPYARQAEIGILWNVLDFGTGYLRQLQQSDRARQAREQTRRVRQQIMFDVLSLYWRAAMATQIARAAEELRQELDSQARSIRDSVDMRILSVIEGARRELNVQNSLTEIESWRKSAEQSQLELARALGSPGVPMEFSPIPEAVPVPPGAFGDEILGLQRIALSLRPELRQQDVQERIAVQEAKVALLQMLPGASLYINAYSDPDKFLKWNNWMVAGAKASWNILSIPVRVSERRMAKIHEQLAKQRGLSQAVAIMAQVGIALSEWELTADYAEKLKAKNATRERLVKALAEGERDGQTRPGEVLQERVRLLTDRAAALRAMADARIAAARLINALGVDVDEGGKAAARVEDGEGDGGIDALREGVARAAAAAFADADVPVPVPAPAPVPAPVPAPASAPVVLPVAVMPAPETPPNPGTAAALRPEAAAALRPEAAAESMRPTDSMEKRAVEPPPRPAREQGRFMTLPGSGPGQTGVQGFTIVVRLPATDADGASSGR